MQHGARIGIVSVLLIVAGAAADEPKGIVQTRGTFVADQLTAVSAALAGRVTEAAVREGELVRKGQLLFRLEPTLARVEVEKAEALVRQAMARLKQIDALREEEKLARLEVAELETLLRPAERDLARLKARAATADQVEKAEDLVRTVRFRAKKASQSERLLVARNLAQKALREAEIETARAELNRARVLLDATDVRAPLDGIVLRVHANVGSFTNPAMQGLATSAVLCDLAEVAGAQTVACEVKPAEALLLAVNQPCLVQAEGVAEALRGLVLRIAPVVERGGVRVVVAVPTGDGKRVRLGTPATVRVLPK